MKKLRRFQILGTNIEYILGDKNVYEIQMSTTRGAVCVYKGKSIIHIHLNNLQGYEFEVCV